MYSIASCVQLLSGRVAVVGIRENVESINCDSSSQMKTNVVKNDSVLALRTDYQRVLWIVSIDSDDIGSCGAGWMRIAGLQFICERQSKIKTTPLCFASGSAIVTILRDDCVAAGYML